MRSEERRVGKECSSDVCSSDLPYGAPRFKGEGHVGPQASLEGITRPAWQQKLAHLSH